jgi:hypothetical protein
MPGKRYRSAGSGRFVPAAFAAANPGTTVAERAGVEVGRKEEREAILRFLHFKARGERECDFADHQAWADALVAAARAIGQGTHHQFDFTTTTTEEHAP